eukprot:403375241
MKSLEILKPMSHEPSHLPASTPKIPILNPIYSKQQIKQSDDGYQLDTNNFNRWNHAFTYQQQNQKIFPCIKMIDHHTLLVGTGNKDLRKIDTINEARGLLFSFDLRDKQVQQQFKGHFDYIMDMEILDNQNYFVSSNHVDKMKVIDQNLLVWDIRTGSVASNQIYMDFHECYCLKKNLFTDEFYGQFSNNSILTFNSLPKFKQIKSKVMKGGHITKTQQIGFDVGMFKQKHQVLISGSQDGKLYMYDTKTCKIVKQLVQEL